MNVIIRLLGRPAVDQPFAELSSASIVLARERVAHTPDVPAGAPGEMTVRVEPDEDAVFALGSWLDPATRPGPTPRFDGDGRQIGTDPGPLAAVRHRKIACGGTARDTAFYPHDSLILAPAGVLDLELTPT